MNPPLERDVLQAFGFHGLETTSLYPWAPVHRIQDDRGDWVLKQTSRHEGGQAHARWTRALEAQGVRVASPAAPFPQNPRVVGEQPWVVYPFLEGSAYHGSAREIEAAGRLLGQIHEAGLEVDVGLPAWEGVEAIERGELEQTLARARQHAALVLPEAQLERAHVRALQHLDAYEAAIGRLGAVSWPRTNASWDYKATNLVYLTPTAPVLIDPDSGGRIPRLFDLAIAALLFANDPMRHQAPSRVLSAREWSWFMRGYFEHGALTEQERRAWPDMLLCAWVDEALWLLSHHETGWRDERERAHLWSLWQVELSSFAFAPSS